MNHADLPKIFNRPEYTQRRQKLRTNMTEPEKRLWKILRNGQMGVKFRRQHGIGFYIADFYGSSDICVGRNLSFSEFWER